MILTSGIFFGEHPGQHLASADRAGKSQLSGFSGLGFQRENEKWNSADPRFVSSGIEAGVIVPFGFTVVAAVSRHSSLAVDKQL